MHTLAFGLSPAPLPTISPPSHHSLPHSPFHPSRRPAHHRLRTPTSTPSTCNIRVRVSSSSTPSTVRQRSAPTTPSMTSDLPVENLVVIGSGPAGYTAAIYAGRANLKPVLLEGMAAGVPGGQLMTTADVENFPGFPDGISGPNLMAQMRAQAHRWGANLLSDDAVAVDLDTNPFLVRTAGNGTIRAHSVIVATGASARRLGVQGEDTFWSRGISACAICDGAAPIFAGVELAVTGGGDSACEEAVYLCKYASHVHLLVRSDTLRASKTLCDRVLNHPSVTVHFNTNVVEALGERQMPDAPGNGSPLKGLRVRDSDKGEEKMLGVRGLFYAIGHTPNTKFLRGSSRLKFDRAGYMVTVPGSPVTPLDGVFAAGDVADKEWRQAVTAAGSGCMAALAAERYLTARGLVTEYHHAEDENQSEARASVEARESEEERNAGQRVDDEESYDIEETWHRGQFALRKLYHESKRPLIVKYVSPNCGPCKQLKPMLSTVVRSLEGQVHYVEIDITVDPEVAEAAGVTGSPTVHIFHEKSLIKEFRGVKMKSEYKRVVEELLKNKVPVR